MQDIFFISPKFLANFDDFSKLCRSHAFLTLQEKKHNYITALMKHLKRWALLEPKMFIVHHHQSIFFVLVLVLLILQPALTFETDTNYDFMNTNQKSEKDDVEKGADNGTTHKKSEEQKVFGGYQFKEVS